MKRILSTIIILVLILCIGLYIKNKYYNPFYRLKKAKKEVELLKADEQIRDGDLIFQTSLSFQSKAIQLATRSKYSHCGIIFKEGDNFFVLEAIRTVRMTPLEKWMARGKDGHYIIKRLRNSDGLLTPATIANMKKTGDQFMGKSYDLNFEWSDNRMYCSELVWKIYQRTTGIEIGKLQKLRDLDLSNRIVKEKLKERYGNSIPWDEKIISPVAILNSNLLITVKSNE